MADMGADVIKVEPPWGESWRLIRQFIPLDSRLYIAVNRGKRSLPMDLGRSQGQEILYKLLPETDVVIVNYRPDVLDKLGIDYGAISQKNPRLIYCENTAFGSKGPQSQLPGYEIIVQAMSGLIASEGKMVNGVPQHIFTPVVDAATGLAMAWAICGALYARERTGLGQKIEASLLGTVLAMQGSRFLCVEAVDGEAQSTLMQEVASFQAQGRPYEEVQAHYQSYHSPSPGNIYYRTYRTQDGLLAVGCPSDTLRHKLLAVLGLRDVRFDPNYRVDSPEARCFGEEITAKAEKLFRQKTTAGWLAILGAVGVPAGPVRFTEELLGDDQVLANDMVAEMEHHLVGKLKMAGHLVKMGEKPVLAKEPSPALGQHTDEILGDLGYTPEQVQQLRDIGLTS